MAEIQCATCQHTFDATLGKCPNCGAPTPATNRPRNWARRLGSWLGWSNWLATALALCLMAGVAVACGMSTEDVMLPLQLALVFLLSAHFTARVYCYYRRLRPRKETPQPDNSMAARFGKGFGSVLGVAIGVTIVGLNTHSAKERTDKLRWQQTRNAEGERDRAKDILGAKTEAYWKASVYRLYEDTPADQADPAENIQVAYNRQTVRLQSLIRQIKAIPTNEISPDLVAMVQRHANSSDSAIARITELQQSIARQDPGEKQSPYTVEQAEALYDQLLTAWERGEVDQIPAKLHPLLEEMLEFENTCDQHFREVEIMQARLSERFPGHRFDLPPEVSP